MDNNAAERALPAIALGRKNYLFAGSDAGGERAAAIYSLLGSAKLNGIDPEEYLTAVLRRIAYHPHRGSAAVESVSGQTDGGSGSMTSPQRDRAHNFRIAGTLRNDTEKLNLDWRLLESKLLAAEAYEAPRGASSTSASRGATSTVTSLFPLNDIRSFWPPTLRASTSSATSGINFLTNVSLALNSSMVPIKTVYPGRLRIFCVE